MERIEELATLTPSAVAQLGFPPAACTEAVALALRGLEHAEAPLRVAAVKTLSELEGNALAQVSPAISMVHL